MYDNNYIIHMYDINMVSPCTIQFYYPYMWCNYIICVILHDYIIAKYDKLNIEELCCY